jgi:hypothetical protein
MKIQRNSILKNSVPDGRQLKILLYIFCSLLFLFLISIALSPLNRTKEWKEMVSGDSLYLSAIDSTILFPAITPVLRELAYTESLLHSSDKDSIHLVVNLKDSLLHLYIKGVRIHSSRLNRFRIDKFLHQIDNLQYYRIFSKPLDVQTQVSTIIKEPIVVHHAPKDTTEAARNAWKPDTLIQNPAFLKLQLDYGIDLIMEMEETGSYRDEWTGFRFHANYKMKRLTEATGNFFGFRKMGYRAGILLELPANEIRSIYRALPVNASLTLYFI